jgi:hypothetical protein
MSSTKHTLHDVKFARGTYAQLLREEKSHNEAVRIVLAKLDEKLENGFPRYCRVRRTRPLTESTVLCWLRGYIGSDPIDGLENLLRSSGERNGRVSGNKALLQELVASNERVEAHLIGIEDALSSIQTAVVIPPIPAVEEDDNLIN